MSNIDSYAGDIKWINAVQQWCEENDPHGIPYMNSTDPYQLYDIPDNRCIVSSFDPELWKKAGRYIGRAWRATGARVDLGPQVDIGTNIIWCRLGGSISEDPATNRDVAKYYGGGMQSTWADDDATDDQGWGKDSVAIMLKHYVGAGAVEGGRNDHNDAGKYDVFPGDNFDAHLIPFLDGGLHLESETGEMAAIMPNYAIAYSEDESLGPIWGGAYNACNIGILRNAGWDGMITTDWQILRATDFGDRAHGVKDMTEAQRFEKLLEATVDQVGGDWAPEIGTEGYKLYAEKFGEDAALERLQEPARRIFTVIISSPDAGSGEPSGGSFRAAPEGTPDSEKYLPISLQYRPYTATDARDPSLAGDIVDGKKENRSYKGKSVTASNESELDLLLNVRKAMPDAKIILIVEGTNNAQCFHEIEPSADAILWSWSSNGRHFGKAYGRILSGETEPSALLPCQMPKDMAEVEKQLEDVPRDVEPYVDSEGNAYDFCFGLNWSGVIDDDRVKTYGAASLTEPETKVTPGEWSKD